MSLHSPVSLDVYDQDGNHIGIPIGQMEDSELSSYDEQISNSYYMEFGEGKYIGFPVDQDKEYRIDLKGLSHGTFTFEMEEVFGDEVLNTKTFTDIPTSPAMTATI